jgi:4-hydroxy-tetrahydrodipicolinate reductase
MRIAIIGAGRMAEAIRGEAGANGDVVVTSITREENGSARALTAERLAGVDVVFEFTTPDAVVSNLRALQPLGVAVVCGTTGWDTERADVEAAWADGPGALLAASNFAIGVHLLLRAARELASAARGQVAFDGFLHERHHAAKRDAPSGTGLRLQEAVRAVDPARDWPITSVRAGAIPGEHELVLDAPYETITLRHEARDRRVFAAGALTAGRWLVGRRGVFTLDALFDGG